jgi:uncharacterized protein
MESRLAKNRKSDIIYKVMEKTKAFQEITGSKAYERTKELRQHGSVTVFEHSLNVAEASLKISKKLHIKVDEESMVKIALLHDYFLYDWHDKNHPKMHGFRHGTYAAENADRDFGLTKKEFKAIKSHMFPLTLLRIPTSREAFILTLSDKYCATEESFDTKKKRKALKRQYRTEA